MLAVPILVPTLAPIQVPMPMGSNLVEPILVVPILETIHSTVLVLGTILDYLPSHFL
jgi:hypothetical protein